MGYGQQIIGCFFIFSAVFAVGTSRYSRNTPTTGSPQESGCRQPTLERDAIIKEAERGQYHIHWIYIVGNTYTRFRDFRRKMADEFNEGYIFERRFLEESVKRISKMKTIYPISMDNIEVRLDRDKKEINFDICVTQKPKR